MRRTQHLHVCRHLFGFVLACLRCEVQSCYFTGSPALRAVGEDDRGGSSELAGAPRPRRFPGLPVLPLSGQLGGHAVLE